MFGFGACRTLLDVSLIHFVVSLLSQIKHSLGLADQRAHASTFECVRLCSEGKIAFLTPKRYDEQPRPFYMGVPLGVEAGIPTNVV